MTIRKPGITKRFDGPTLPDTLSPLGGGGGGGASGMDDPLQPVFVSPRVIDQRAFDDLSSRLRALIEQAMERQQDLRGALERASSAAATIKAGEIAQQTSMDVAARAIARVEERVLDAERILEKATGVNSAVEDFDRRSLVIIEDKLAVLTERMEQAERASAERAAVVQRGLSEATAALQQRVAGLQVDAQEILAPNLAVLDAACARAAELVGRVVGSDDILPGSLADLVIRGESVRSAASAAEERLVVLRQQASSAATDLDAGVARANTAADELDKHRDRIASEASLAADAAQRALADVQPQVEAAAGELRALIAESREAHATSAMALRVTEGALERLSQTLASLEPWTNLVVPATDGRDEPVELPEPLRRLIDAVRVELRQDLVRIGDALRLAAVRADRALGEVDSIGADATLSEPASGVTRPMGRPIIVARPILAKL